MIRVSRNDSLITSDVLPPAGGLISHLKSILIYTIILNISIQCFMFKMSKHCICNWLKHSMSLWAALNSVWIHLNTSATSAKINFDDTGFICLGAA